MPSSSSSSVRVSCPPYVCLHEQVCTEQCGLPEATCFLVTQVLEFQSDAVDSAAVAEAWLNSLPLTVDEVEAQGSHALLVRLIEQSDPRCSCGSCLLCCVIYLMLAVFLTTFGTSRCHILFVRVQSCYVCRS